MIKEVVCNEKVALFIGYHIGNVSGWEISADMVIGITPYYVAIWAGWGYSDLVPLRPWPKTWYKHRTQNGNITSGIAWCGFFITIGK